MGGALAGHTLFFLQNLIPRLPHVRVLLCDGVEQGKVGVVCATWVRVGVVIYTDVRISVAS